MSEPAEIESYKLLPELFICNRYISVWSVLLKISYLLTLGYYRQLNVQQKNKALSIKLFLRLMTFGCLPLPCFFVIYQYHLFLEEIVSDEKINAAILW